MTHCYCSQENVLINHTNLTKMIIEIAKIISNRKVINVYYLDLRDGEFGWKKNFFPLIEFQNNSGTLFQSPVQTKTDT